MDQRVFDPFLNHVSEWVGNVLHRYYRLYLTMERLAMEMLTMEKHVLAP